MVFSYPQTIVGEFPLECKSDDNNNNDNNNNNNDNNNGKKISQVYEAADKPSFSFQPKCVIFSQHRRIDTLLHLYYGLVAGMWHLKRSSISSASPTQKVSMGLVVNFQTMQQPTILVIFFQIRDYSQDYRHRASLVFYYSYQYCFCYYCY